MKEICANCKLRFHCDRLQLSMKTKKFSRARKNWNVYCQYFCPVEEQK